MQLYYFYRSALHLPLCANVFPTVPERYQKHTMTRRTIEEHAWSHVKCLSRHDLYTSNYKRNARYSVATEQKALYTQSWEETESERKEKDKEKKRKKMNKKDWNWKTFSSKSHVSAASWLFCESRCLGWVPRLGAGKPTGTVLALASAVHCLNLCVLCVSPPPPPPPTTLCFSFNRW